jgi:hypothetical protein
MTRTEALKALDTALWRARAAATPTSILHIQVGHAIDALSQLKTALAQPEQEPVAWLSEGGNFSFVPYQCSTPLYTTPPQRTWVGLSREDCYQVRERESDAFMYGVAWAEAKLKEKNNG